MADLPSAVAPGAATPGAATMVIVPTYNEIANLAALVGRVLEFAPEATVLVVDDASPDGTGELADELGVADSRIRVLHRPGKEGIGRAYLAGFDVALDGGFDYIVEIDADGSHDPAELPAMLALAAERADLVIGSRRVAGGAVSNWPWTRRAISRAGNWYARTMLRSRIGDITAGYRVFRSSALADLDLANVSSQGYCFQVELAWRLERGGHRVVEHPITFVERAHGHSKMHLGIVVEALLRVTQWSIFGLPKAARKSAG